MIIPLLVRSTGLKLNLLCQRMASSSSSKYLISNSNYKPFLSELGLQEENLGVFDGQWFGNGEVRFIFIFLN